MGKRIKAIITIVCAFAGLYLLGSFVAWDFNPANWNPYGKIILGVWFFWRLTVTINDTQKD